MKTHHSITSQIVGNADDSPFIHWLCTNDTPTTSLLEALQARSDPPGSRELARKTGYVDHPDSNFTLPPTGLEQNTLTRVSP